MSSSRPRTADENALDQRLLVAAACDDLVEIERLLRKGAWIDASERETDHTALIVALKNRRLKAARLLIDAGATLNISTAFGSTPLSFAVEYGDYALVEQMLKMGADPNTFRESAVCALDIAVHRDPAMTRLLLEYGATPNVLTIANKKNLTRQYTPLIRACLDSRVEEAKVLLDHGADPNAGPCVEINVWQAEGETELSYVPDPPTSPSLLYHAGFTAAAANQVELLKLLKKAGCRLDHINRGGYNALDWALQQEAREAIEFLRAEGLRSRDERLVQ